MKTINNNQTGFTLVEVLVAVVVLAIGLSAAATMQTRAVEQSTFATRTSDSVAVAERYIEDLITRPIGDDNDTIFNNKDFVPNGWSVRIKNGNQRWLIPPSGYYLPVNDLELRVLQDTPVANLATVQVNVIPKVNPDKRDDMTVRLFFVRSMRWN